VGVLADPLATADENFEDHARPKLVLEGAEPKTRLAGDFLHTLHWAARAAASDDYQRTARRANLQHPNDRLSGHQAADQPHKRERAKQPWCR
jgi:hypothetical protein